MHFCKGRIFHQTGKGKMCNQIETNEEAFVYAYLDTTKIKFVIKLSKRVKQKLNRKANHENINLLVGGF